MDEDIIMVVAVDVVMTVDIIMVGATFITGIFKIPKRTFTNIFSFIMSFYMMLLVDRIIL